MGERNKKINGIPKDPGFTPPALAKPEINRRVLKKQIREH
jgi:hypothetical protein